MTIIIVNFIFLMSNEYSLIDVLIKMCPLKIK